MNNVSKSCSIIIRTKNEERWIVPCLKAVYEQSYRDFEVVIVDNESTDRTLEKVRQFPVDKVMTCTDYLPGKALNIGIEASKGKWVVCLSGHCIPVDDQWLGNLVANMEDPQFAGAYGRQEPMDFTPASDKRDLLTIFGQDRRVQVKDSFFHNANSVIRRELWEQHPFDDQISNIEDRIWAQKIIQLGYQLVYDPTASVYHYHGIHQNGNTTRCNNVVRILENLNENFVSGNLDPENLLTVAIIPLKGPALTIGDSSTLQMAIQDAKTAQYIKKVIVSTDNESVAQTARELGAEVPFLRPPELSRDYVGIEAVLKYTLEQIEQIGIYPDLVVNLEATFPFRPKGLIDGMIRRTVAEDLDSVIAVKPENRSIWQEDEKKTIQRLDSGYVPRLYKERTFVGLKGLCCVTRTQFLRKEHLLGDNIGLFEVDNPFANIEVREELDFQLAEQIYATWQLRENII